jgi:L-ascorbate metabolism protein UlaG (beta-lactamase superfamily)
MSATPSRKRILAIAFFAGVLVLAGCAESMIAQPAYYSGPRSDHFDGKHFFNPEGESGSGGAQKDGLVRLLEIGAGDTRHVPWPHIPVHQTIPPRQVEGDVTRVTWIGHASTLVQTNGLNILFDPVWADRSSPVQFAGPQRVRAPGVKLQDLPPIDLILISHDHYDHLDLDTLHYLANRDHPRIVTGLGNDRLLAGYRLSATAGDWGQTIPIRPGLSVRIMRAHHWSARWLNDKDSTLWVGFRVMLPSGDIYYSGDTGPGDMAWAREAAAGPRPRLALLPIGPYKITASPTGNHIDPGQAVSAFAMINPAYALGVHWGTFQLGDEPVDGAPKRLRAALIARGIDPERFRTNEPGQGWDIPSLSIPPAAQPATRKSTTGQAA